MKNTRRIAFGGVISAFSLVSMLLSGLFPLAEYTCPALAGMLLVALVIDFGKRTAWLAFGAVAILALVIVPNKESALMFAFLFGYYPILKASIEQVKSRILEWVLKFAVFNVAVVAAYWLMTNALGMVQVLEDAVIGSLTLPVSLALLLLAGNVTFGLYDVVLSRLIVLYCNRVRPRLQTLLK